MLNTYKNKNFTKRNYECTNIVCCQAETAPAEHWEKCSDSEMTGLDYIYTENGVRFFGYL